VRQRAHCRAPGRLGRIEGSGSRAAVQHGKHNQRARAGEGSTGARGYVFERAGASGFGRRAGAGNVASRVPGAASPDPVPPRRRFPQPATSGMWSALVSAMDMRTISVTRNPRRHRGRAFVSIPTARSRFRVLIGTSGVGRAAEAKGRRGKTGRACPIVTLSAGVAGGRFRGIRVCGEARKASSMTRSARELSGRLGSFVHNFS